MFEMPKLTVLPIEKAAVREASGDFVLPEVEFD